MRKIPPNVMRAISSLLLAMETLLPAQVLFALSGTGVLTVAPPAEEDPGWANVGTVNGGPSCVYLGSYASGFWVISAAHVIASDSSGTAQINGASYSIVAGSGVRLANIGNATYPFADLYMFRVAGDAALASLGNVTVATQSPSTTGSTASMTVIGWGGGVKGYGSLTVTRTGLAPGSISISGANGASALFLAESPGVRLIAGDSGGGLFAKDNGTWKLYGLSEASGMSGSNYLAVASDLSAYAGQIEAYTVNAVPEPAAYGAAAGGILFAAALFRRHRRAA